MQAANGAKKRRRGFFCQAIAGTASAQKQLQVFGGQVPQETVVSRNDRFGQATFVILQLQDLLLDRVAGNQPVGEHVAILSDAVGTIDRLRFDGRIPPRVEDEHIVGGGQVQPQSTGLQTDEKQRALGIRLKALYLGLPLDGAAVEILVDDTSTV